MPFTWRINIKPNPAPTPSAPAIFEFDQPPQIQVGDQVIWSNDDTVAHFPTPDDPNVSFLSNQVAAKSTSPAFAPGKPGTITYKCSLHPGETGNIVVK